MKESKEFSFKHKPKFKAPKFSVSDEIETRIHHYRRVDSTIFRVWFEFYGYPCSGVVQDIWFNKTLFKYYHN